MGNDNIFGGSWLFAFLIIAILFGGGNFLNRGNGAGVEAAINSAINNQTTQTSIRDVLLSSANNNYETLQAINGQTMAIMQQNYANQINAVQGFNTINQNISTQGAGIQEAISRLSYQMDSCCCAIKTQMLQDKYDALAEQYRNVQNDASNAAQSQYLLATMGKWIANPSATTA